MSKNVFTILNERGFINAASSESLEKTLSKPCKVYCGFDPTADSLHLGHLIGIIGLRWFQVCGHQPVVLIGGATAMVGDPSGKSKERNLLSAEVIQHNIAAIKREFSRFLSEGALYLNNADWFAPFSLLDFLRDVGKSFRIGPMLGKESVRQRMASEEGISFTEFTYQLLQAYDFAHLFEQHGVTVQIGGSDQWGNITAGIEYVRKTDNQEVHGITFPLLTGSDGQKLGKTEAGAIWLAKEKLPVYKFYQYFFRISDADVGKLLRLLTFLDIAEITQIEGDIETKPNAAQRRLAEEVTRFVHGEAALEEAKRVTAQANPGHQTTLDKATLEALEGTIPSFSLPQKEMTDLLLIDLLVHLDIQQSKGAVRRLIRNRGLYLNNQSIEDENFCLTASDLIAGELMLVAIGKKNKFLIRAI